MHNESGMRDMLHKVCIYAVSLVHPGFLDLLLMPRDFVARLHCVKMCGILIKTASIVQLFQKSHSLQFFPGHEFETENGCMDRKTWLYGFPTSVVEAEWLNPELHC